MVLIDDVQFLAGAHQDARGVLPHLQRAARFRPPARDDLRPPPRGAAGPRGRACAERFRAGLVVELEPPRFEVRRAILDKRARLDGVDVSTTCSAEIARRVDSSVRALEGALIRVVAYASLKGEPPTPASSATCCAGSARTRRRSLRPHGDPRRHGAGVRRRPERCWRATAGPGRRRTPGRHVPGARADRAQPARDRTRHRRTQPHHRHPRRRPRQRRLAPTRLCATPSTTCARGSAGPRDGRPHCQNQQLAHRFCRIRASQNSHALIDLSTGTNSSNLLVARS